MAKKMYTKKEAELLIKAYDEWNVWRDGLSYRGYIISRTESNLLPCPFCGSEAERCGDDIVRCSDNYKCPTGFFSVVGWNTRAQEGLT